MYRIIKILPIKICKYVNNIFATSKISPILICDGVTRFKSINCISSIRSDKLADIFTPIFFLQFNLIHICIISAIFIVSSVSQCMHSISKIKNTLYTERLIQTLKNLTNLYICTRLILHTR